MQIEIGAPACLPLALVSLEDGTPGRLGVALRHPAINLAARAGNWLDVTGARADRVAAAAQGYLERAGLPHSAVIEVELATPSHMGLGSDVLMTLAGAQAAAWVHDRPFTDIPSLAAAAGLGPEHALEVNAYGQGGVLIVDFPPPGASPAKVRRRQTLSHPDDRAWAFVLYLPRVPAGASPTLEADRLSAWQAAGPQLNHAAARPLTEALWAALEADDIEGFGRALLALQALNAAALERAGHAWPLTDAEQAILAIYQVHGAVAWGRSPTGLALYALIRGAAPSVAVRKKVVERVGITGGTVMASVVDNTGTRHQLQPSAPNYSGASPLVAGNR